MTALSGDAGKRASRLVYCRCDQMRLPAEDCARCPVGDYYDDDASSYVEPPLYNAGVLRGMSGAALIRERRRQSNIHDAAVDRCEEINSPTIETAMARYRLCDAEVKRRLKAGASHV